MSVAPRSGQVAEAAGVNIQPLRHHERRGLPAEPERRNGGRRPCGEDAVTARRVIKAAQRLGFTPEEIADLTAVRAAPAAAVEVVSVTRFTREG
ncbi:hypothetical protein GCM10010275_36390 [Streptomyces litmocidini]|uniref:MerR family transcriptional regulator n=1 Tax=Streptomyces litmocidini TaxID=67318 RepID=UPI00167D6BB9|nr:MerR family transcriptional regulator [Streptomyces litmocidini]GGU95253.1 hypothetical protein GCM10010275_36390 [Streptomyces litmocidini]